MTEARNFRVVRMFHPTQHVLSLEESERFFQRFFGRPTDMAETVMKQVVPPDSGYPTDYCAFTTIREVCFDTVVPEKFIPGGVQVYASVERPTLKSMGWYTEGLGDLFATLRERGYAMTTTMGGPMTEFQSKFPVPGGKPMFFTTPAETGLRYQFFEEGSFFFDERPEPGWALGPVEPDCPFGLEFCSHHTIMTSAPDRALKLLVGVLGGRIIDQGRNDARQATSTYVALADGVYELAIPDKTSPAAAALAAQAPLDIYHSLTWKVGDLAKVEGHLAAIGVGIVKRTDDMLIVDPAQANGIPWGFTTRLRTGDERSVTGG